MSDLKISQLQELFNPYSSDVIPIVHEGITKKTPINTIVRHLSTTLDEQGLVFIGTNYQNVSSHWENTYTVVAANSAQWAIDNDDVAVNTLVRSNSAIWNTVGAYQGTDVKVLTGNWQSTYNTVRSNSATNWNYQGTDLKSLSAGWVGGNAAFTNLVANSAAYLSSVDLSFLSVSANWNSVYNTVLANSATNWNYQGTDLKGLSANWQSTYNTFRTVSSTFLTSETDSQTLSFDKLNNNLTISNGNTVSLSSLVDQTAIDTQTRNLTGNWQNTYNTVQSNSATTWNYQGTDLKGLSANWQSTYNTFKAVSSTFLTAETDSQTLSFNEETKDLSISNGNTVSLSAFGTGSDTELRSLTGNWESSYTTVKDFSGSWQDTFTIMQAKSAVWDEAVTSGYTGTDIKALTGNWESTYNTFKAVSSTFLTSETDSQALSFDEGTKDLSISNGNTISLSALVDSTATDTSVRNLTGNWQSVYSTVQSNSATTWNYQGTDLKELSGNWQSTYTTVWSKSADWDAAFGTAGADVAVRALTGKWDSTYSTVNANSATAWNYQGTDLKDLSANWQSTLATVSSNSAKWESVYSNVVANSALYATESSTNAKFLPLTGGTVTGPTQFNSNLTVYGNISATGSSYFSNTFYSTTSALSVVNLGNSGPALYVGNNGTGDIASFYDIDQNVEVLHVGGSNGTFPNVGIKTSQPNKDLTVKGEISATGDIWTTGRILSGGQELLSIITPSIESVFSTVQTNSAVNWNYQGTDLKNLSSGWVGGNSAYTTVYAKSASWDAAFGSAGADAAVRALTGNWESTYNTVLANSATNWNYQGTDLKGLSANWQSTYNTFRTVSSTFLTSETDSQTLSFNEGTKGLSISNSNTVSLSSLVDAIATDTSVRNLTGNWQNTYNTVQSNSATTWNYQGTDLKSLSSEWVGGNAAFTAVQSNSANWNSVYSNVNSNSASYASTSFANAKFFPLTGGTVTGNALFQNNVTIYGNLSCSGIQTFANTIFATTSALSVVHVGSGPAVWVGNNGTGDIASFYDIDQNVEVLHVGGINSTFPNVGIKVSNPNKDFTVKGELSASGDIWTSGRILSGGQELLSIIAPNINSVFSTVQSNSATNWNYQGTDLKNLSAQWVGGNSAFTTVQSNSANWNSVYSSVRSASANYILDGGNTKGSNLLIGTNDNFNLALETNGLPRVTILSSGNVGIGTSSPRSQAMLEVRGGRTFLAANNEQYGLGVCFASPGGAVYFGATSDSTTPDAAISNAGGLTLATFANSGNVGINESSPEGKLHVTAGSAGSVTAQPSSVGVFESSGHAYLSLLSPTSRSAGVVMGGPTNPYGSYVSWNHDNLALKVATNHAGASIQMLAGTEQEALRITSAGNVGIGTTSPTDRLTVAGNTTLSGLHLAYATQTKATPAIISKALQLDLASASFFSVNLNSNITGGFTLINVPASPKTYTFTLQFVFDSFPRIVIWPTGTRWSGGTPPTLTSVVTKVDTFTFLTHDGGTNWFAYTNSQNQ